MATPCPRCGTASTVQERNRSRGSAEQHCVSCGYGWRWSAPGSDAFSLILAHKVHATAPVEDEHEPRRGVFRAARFLVRLPFRYRVVGSREWDVGLTENISRSGILFYAEPSGALVQALASKPVLDIKFELPHDGGNGVFASGGARTCYNGISARRLEGQGRRGRAKGRRLEGQGRRGRAKGRSLRGGSARRLRRRSCRRGAGQSHRRQQAQRHHQEAPAASLS